MNSFTQLLSPGNLAVGF